MEGINKITSIENRAGLNDKEMIFDSLIMEEIVNAFIEDLDNAGFNKKEIDKFLIEINTYNEESVKGILAIPKELRERNFVKYKALIDDNKTTIKEIIKKNRRKFPKKWLHFRLSYIQN